MGCPRTQTSNRTFVEHQACIKHHASLPLLDAPFECQVSGYYCQFMALTRANVSLQRCEIVSLNPLSWVLDNACNLFLRS